VASPTVKLMCLARKGLPLGFIVFFLITLVCNYGVIASAVQCLPVARLSPSVWQRTEDGAKLISKWIRCWMES